MSTSQTQAVPKAPAVGLLNPIIKRLLGAGLPFGPNVLMTVRGRKSGTPHTFPVAILASDGRRFVQSPFGDVNWVRNLRASGTAILTKGAHREEVDAIALEPEVAGTALREALAPYLRSRLTGIVVRHSFHVRADSSIEDYVELARSHPMFELTAPRAVDAGGAV